VSGREGRHGGRKERDEEKGTSSHFAGCLYDPERAHECKEAARRSVSPFVAYAAVPTAFISSLLHFDTG
jgi:hypothetical protein